MGFEQPAGTDNAQESPQIETETHQEKEYRSIVDATFNKESIKSFMRDSYPQYAHHPEELTDERVERELEGFVEAMKGESRFGSEEDASREYVERLKQEFSKLALPEERVAFLRGLTDLRRGSYAKRSLAIKIEDVEEGKAKPIFNKLDTLVAKGELMRGILDRGSAAVFLKGEVEFAGRYEKASGKEVFGDLEADLSRLLNEGVDSDGEKLPGNVTDGIAAELRRAGLVVKWELKDEGGVLYSVEGKREK